MSSKPKGLTDTAATAPPSVEELKPTLENELDELAAMLRIMEVVREYDGVEDFDLERAGEIALERASDIVDRVRTGLPIPTLNTRVFER